VSLSITTVTMLLWCACHQDISGSVLAHSLIYLDDMHTTATW